MNLRPNIIQILGKLFNPLISCFILSCKDDLYSVIDPLFSIPLTIWASNTTMTRYPVYA